MKVVEKRGRWYVIDGEDKVLFTSWDEFQKYMKKYEVEESVPLEDVVDDLDYGETK